MLDGNKRPECKKNARSQEENTNILRDRTSITLIPK